MLDDAFPDLECQVEPRKTGIAVLEPLDDSERMDIVVEAVPIGAHEAVELSLAGVGERRMPNIVDQGKGFGEFLVESEGAGDRTGDLRDFERVSKAGAEVIGKTFGEDLGLAFQAAER